MCMGAGASSSCPVNETCALGVEDFTWNRTWVTRPCGEGDPKLSDMSVVQLADFCDQYELDISMAAKMAYEISVGHNWTRVRGFWAVKGTNLLSTQRKVLDKLKAKQVPVVVSDDTMTMPYGIINGSNAYET